MRICFWGDIATALTGNTKGGGQLQIAVIAKVLAKCGHEVIVLDHETDSDYVTDEGIRIIKIRRWNDGPRMIRTFTHRLPQLYRTFLDVKADIYYCRIRDFRHILAFWASRRNRAKFVLGIASDLDIIDFKTRWAYTYTSHLRTLWDLVNSISSELVYPYLLKKADLILVQHEGQKHILNNKGIKCKVLYNFIDNSKLPVRTEHNNDFIYIGSLDKRKGFREFVSLIKETPSYQYIIVGQPRDKTASLLYEELRSLHNVILLGHLSHPETLKHLCKARALISTSKQEGFPNIFIESWALGIPVISLYVDPGGVIEKENLGFVAQGDIKSMISIMSETYYSDAFRDRAVKYVNTYHVISDKRINETESLFSALLSQNQ